MNLYHSIPLPIKNGENSTAFASFITPSKLFIFVHGFNGSATKTWGNFPEMVLTNIVFSDFDVVFYGYDSLNGQAQSMSISLFKLIDSLISNFDMPLPNRWSEEKACYDEVYLVAHSLGAVVSRLALLYAYERRVSWISKCKLILYAPAHFGSRLIDNFSDCFEGVSRLFKSFSYSLYPILIDLKEDSKLITGLYKKTQELLLNDNTEFLKAAYVVWAEHERVVVCEKFLNDKLQEQVDATNHVGVCKPSYDFTEPFEHLLAAIS